MENIQNNENIQKIVLRAGHYVDNDAIFSTRHTKALKLEYMSNTDKEYDNRESWGELLLSAHDKPAGINVTTWSSLFRQAIDILKPHIKFACSMFPDIEEFKATFESCLKHILEVTEHRLNANCPERLYKRAEELDLIHSRVYMNNQNHFTPIIKDENDIEWGVCAVFTGEVVIMLEALLDTIYTMVTEYTQYQDKKEEFPHFTFVLTYISKKDEITEEDIEEQVDDIDNEIQNLQLSKDLIQLQKKLAHVNSVTMELYSDIENIQKKYGLKTIDDLLKSIN